MKTDYRMTALKRPSDEQLAEIKQALVEKGVATENTPYSDLDDAINNIELKETFETINLDSKKKLLTKMYDYVYYHSNGIDAYGSYSSSSKKGIWHWNVITGEETQVYSTSYNWQYFFEDSKGNVYVSSSLSSGLVCLNGAKANKTNAINACWQYFFEDSKGNVYASSNSNGILHLNGTVATQIYETGYWNHFFESNSGNLYVGSNNSYAIGIIYLNEKTAIQVYTLGNNWQYFFEDSKGNVYAGNYLNSGDSSGIVCLNGTTATRIYTLYSSWSSCFEDSKGNTYFGGGKGILHFDGETITQIYSNESYWQYFFEDSKGNVYVGGGLNSGAGLVNLNGKTATRISTIGYKWQYFFEDSKGNVYVGSSKSDTGILHLNGTIATQIYLTSYWQYFTENPKGVIASKKPQPDDQDFLLIDENNNVYLMRE
jgi:hypothetical protein